LVYCVECGTYIQHFRAQLDLAWLCGGWQKIDKNEAFSRQSVSQHNSRTTMLK